MSSIRDLIEFENLLAYGECKFLGDSPRFVFAESSVPADSLEIQDVILSKESEEEVEKLFHNIEKADAEEDEKFAIKFYDLCKISDFGIFDQMDDFVMNQNSIDPSNQEDYSINSDDNSENRNEIPSNDSSGQSNTADTQAKAMYSYESEEDKESSNSSSSYGVSSTSSSGYEMGRQIEQGLEGIFELSSKASSQDPNKKRRGRPEANKDLSNEKLQSLFEDSIKDLDLKISEKSQRSDARTATINRHVKKFSDKFLKHIGSKCKYKSKHIEEVMQSYLKAFYLGFCPFFQIIGKDEMREMFYHFIVLCFPEQKVKTIFETLVEEGYISEGKGSAMIGQLAKRKAAQKKSFQLLYKNNSCFRVIVKTVLNTLKDEINKDVIYNTLLSLSLN